MIETGSLVVCKHGFTSDRWGETNANAFPKLNRTDRKQAAFRKVMETTDAREDEESK